MKATNLNGSAVVTLTVETGLLGDYFFKIEIG